MPGYQDLFISISKNPEGQFITTASGPAGSVTQSFMLPYESEALSELLRDLSTQSVSMGEVGRSFMLNLMSQSEVHAEAIGQALYDSVFHGPIKEVLENSLLAAKNQDEGLRVNLETDPALPEISVLPWELLYDASQQNYLALSAYSPVVRQMKVPGSLPTLSFLPPLRILVVISSPKGVASLDLAHESAQIRDNWGKRLDVQVDFLEIATISRLQEQLAATQYHVLHFMGHGDFDQESGQGVLVMEKEDGTADFLTGKSLAVLLRDEPTLRLVFLNACKTAESSDQRTGNPFGGIASASLLGGAPAVIAMQFPVSDKAAITFANKIYGMLPGGHPLDYIVAEGRKAIYLQNNASTEWATPVLFMQQHSGVIFSSGNRQTPLAGKKQEIFSRMMMKVKQFWVEGKLDQDLPFKPPIILGKDLKPEAVKASLSDGNDQQRNSRKIPRGKPIGIVFDEMDRSLLVLGEPGCGKSITALELARDLIRKHEQDASHPVPVVLFLTSWPGNGLTLREWAVKEISQTYKIPKKDCENWLEEGRMVLILDGLDEVLPQIQSDCIQAINQFQAEETESGHPNGLVVCSRYEAYVQLAEKCELHGAVLLQPLDEGQIREYLVRLGSAVKGLQQILDGDENLREEAKSPMMIAMMTLAYSMAPEKFVNPEANTHSHKEVVAAALLDRTFEQKASQMTPYSREEILTTLRWLAKQLSGHSNRLFQIEHLQPDWLPSSRWRSLNLSLFSLVLGVLLGIIMDRLWYASNLVDTAEATVSFPFWVLVCVLWAYSAVYWDSMIQKSPDRFSLLKVLPTDSWPVRILREIPRFVVYYALWMALWTATKYIRIWLGFPPAEAWLSHPIQGGLTVCILYGLRVSSRNRNVYIGASESLIWSWKSALKGMGWGLGISLIIFVGYWGYHTYNQTGVANLTNNLKLYPPLGTLIGLLFGGTTFGLATTKTRPNEGIYLALKNAGFATVIMAPIVAISMGFILSNAFPDQEFSIILEAIIWVGLICVIIFFLWFGGFDAIRHGILRLMISLSSGQPLMLSRRLDAASKGGLLQKIGGGYMFPNTLLQEYIQKGRE